jgi:kynurenine formamidase
MPSYDELPVLDKLGLPCAWGVFGEGDQLGCLNKLTPKRVLQSAALVLKGEVISLDLPMNAIDPPLYRREPAQHEIFRISRNSLDDRLDSFFLQSTSQWDGFRHVQAREFGFWGGETDDSKFQPGAGPLGIEHWAEHGMVGRGVLLDVARYLSARGDYDPFVKLRITPELLDDVARAQDVELLPGDVLCIRTGWIARYLALTAEEKHAFEPPYEFAGVDGSESAARWLWDHHVAALTADNPAVEVSPGDPAVGSLHRRAVPLLGLPLGELLDFEKLAVACQADSRYDFQFAAVPLKVVGAVGSPANAIAIR